MYQDVIGEQTNGHRQDARLIGAATAGSIVILHLAQPEDAGGEQIVLEEQILLGAPIILTDVGTNILNQDVMQSQK